MWKKLTGVCSVLMALFFLSNTGTHTAHAATAHSIHPGEMVFRFVPVHGKFPSLQEAKETNVPIEGCTIAYTKRKRFNTYLVTAGHCFFYTERSIGSPVYMDIQGGPQQIGTIDRINYTKTRGALLHDAMLIKVLPKWSRLVNNSVPEIHSVFSGFESKSKVLKLSPSTKVCKLGFTSHLQCGKIADTYGTYYSLDILSQPADSGAPIFVKNSHGKYVVIGINNTHLPHNASRTLATYMNDPMYMLHRAR